MRLSFTGEPVCWKKVTYYLKWLLGGARTADECAARWSEIADVRCTWHSAEQGARARAVPRAESRPPSDRVSVIKPRSTRCVGGKAAPTRRGLEKWLADNPGGRPTDAWIAANFDFTSTSWRARPDAARRGRCAP